MSDVKDDGSAVQAEKPNGAAQENPEKKVAANGKHESVGEREKEDDIVPPAPLESLQHNLCISKTTLLEDTASVSQSLFGNFLPNQSAPNLVLLRANSMIELYALNPEAKGTDSPGLTLITTYRPMTNIKISKIIKVRKPPPLLSGRATQQSAPKDLLVVQVVPLKLMTLELDEQVNEFRMVCMHNLSNDVRLKESGRLNQARQGFLQSFYLERQVNLTELEKSNSLGHQIKQIRSKMKKQSLDQQDGKNQTATEVVSGFIYLADSCKVVVIQFKQELVGGAEGEAIEDHQEDQLGGQELSADYVDVFVLDRKGTDVPMARKRAESLLHPTRIVDINRLKVLPNPIVEYLSQLKEDMQKRSTADEQTGQDSLKFSESWSKEAKDLPFQKHQANIDYVFHKDVQSTDRLQQNIEERLPQMYMPAPDAPIQQQHLIEQAKQRAETKVISIRDLKVIEAHSTRRNQTINGHPFVNIFVLHQVHLEKTTGTECKPPTFNLNIYELDLLSLGSHVPTAKPSLPAIRLTHCLQRLNHYTRLIVPQVTASDMMPKTARLPGGRGGSQARDEERKQAQDNGNANELLDESNSQEELLKTDLVYIVSNVSIYAFRQERNTLTEVYTTSLANIIKVLSERERLVSERTHNSKEMPPVVKFQQACGEEASEAHGFNLNESIYSNAIDNQESIKAGQAVHNTIDKSDLEIKLDGCTRFYALPNNRLLILMENQDKWIVHFRFDQADLDVAAVDFIKVNFTLELNQHMVPSSIAVQMYESHSADLDFRTNRNCQSFIVAVSSYYNDQQTFVLRPFFDAVLQEEQPAERRQNTQAEATTAQNAAETAGNQWPQEQSQLEGDNQIVSQSSQTQLRNQPKRTLRNPIPDSYSLDPIASLPTLAPITGILQLSPSDLIISSGSQQSATLTLVRDIDGSALAVKAQPLLEEQGIEEVFSLILPAEGGFPLTQFIVLAMQRGSTRVIEYSSGGGLKEVEQQKNKFVTDQKSISVQSLSLSPNGPWLVIQVTETMAKCLEFERQAKEFKDKAEYVPDGGKGKIIQAIEIRRKSAELEQVALEQDQGGEVYLVVEASDHTRRLVAVGCQDMVEDRNVLQCLQGIDVLVACAGDVDELVVVARDHSLLILRRSSPGQPYSIAIQTSSGVLSTQAALLVDERKQDNLMGAYLPASSCSTDLTQLVRPDVQRDIKKNWFFKKNILQSVQKLAIVDIYVQCTGMKNFLYVLLDNGRVHIYESMPIGFKIYKSQFLEKLQVCLKKRPGEQVRQSTYRKCFYGEQNQVLAMIQKAVGHDTKTCCLVTTHRNGRLLFNTLKDTEFAGIASHARILGKVKQGGPKACQQPSQYFLCVINDAATSMTTLSMGIHATGHAFDPRIPANPVSSGVCLKQYFLKGRGIKCMTIHKGQYLVVSTFRKAPTLNAPRQGASNKGFKPGKNMAQDYKYWLEVYELPQFYHVDENGAQHGKQMWNRKDLAQLSNMIQDFEFDRADEIVSSMESLKLTVKLQQQPMNQQVQLPADFKENDEFLLVSTIFIESKLDQTLYPSCLYVFKIVPSLDPQTGQRRPKLLMLDKVHLKRLISCLTAYRGHLISVQNEKTDFKIVLQTIQVKMDDGSQAQNVPEQVPYTGDLTQTYQGLKYFIDQNSQQPFPNSIQNMARYIGVELEDYIIIGDIYKSFQIFKRKNAAELANDRITDESRISLKMRFQSRIDANCVGVYCFGINKAMDPEEVKKLLEVDLTGDLKQTSLLSASLDGTIRIHEIGGQKALECTSQLNVMDNILRVLPIKVEEANSKNVQQRKFLLVTRHGGLLEVKQCPIQYQKTVQMLQMQLSSLLPFALGMTPVPCLPQGHQSRMLDQHQSAQSPDTVPSSFQSATKDLGIAPCNSILQFTRSIRAQYETIERIDQLGTLTTPTQLFKPHSNASQTSKLTEMIIQPNIMTQLNESKIVDARLAVNEFLALSHEIQEYIAMRMGYKDLADLWKVVMVS